MPAPLAFLHTAPSNVATFTDLLAELAPDIAAAHVVDETLLSEACEHGYVTPAVERRVHDAVQCAAGDGAAVVLCTCSSIGAAALTATDHRDAVVLRVDEPMAREAVTLGPRITVAATLVTTLEPTKDLIQSAARREGKQVELTDLLCASAWDKLQSGDRDGYFRDVADQLEDAASKTDVIVLAQASMAAAAQLRPNLSVPVLTSPRSGIRAAIAAYRSHSR